MNDVQTDWTDGFPVIACYDETNDAVMFGYKDGLRQLENAVPNAGGVLDLALDLGLGSRMRARIVFVNARET